MISLLALGFKSPDLWLLSSKKDHDSLFLVTHEFILSESIFCLTCKTIANELVGANDFEVSNFEK